MAMAVVAPQERGVPAIPEVKGDDVTNHTRLFLNEKDSAINFLEAFFMLGDK